MIKTRSKVKDGVSLNVGKGIEQGFKIIPNVKVELFDEFGKLKQNVEVHNTVMNAGLYGIMEQLMVAPSLTKAGWMEVGTGTGGTTKLNAYVAGSRTAFGTLSRANGVVTMITTFIPTVGTGALTEAGVFDVVTENTVNMWMYTTFATVNKLAADSLVLTWTLTLTAV